MPPRQRRWITVAQQQAREAEFKRIGDEAASFFTSAPRLKHVGYAGLGRHGGALLFNEVDASGARLRRMVIKYSFGGGGNDDADEHLRNEFRWLQALRGAEHIVQLLRLDEANPPIELPGLAEGVRDLLAPGGPLAPDDPAADQERWATVWRRARDRVALLVMACFGGPDDAELDAPLLAPSPPAPATPPREYLENGVVRTFVERLKKARQRVPNRFYWYLWLCLLRQCIAMNSPPNKGWDTPVERERLKQGPPYRLTQNSRHLDNIMFGSPAPDDLEHGMIPVLKLIDFGRGRIRDDRPDDPGLANRININDSAWKMVRIIGAMWNDNEHERVVDDEDMYLYQMRREDGRRMQFPSDAPTRLAQHARLDRDLRDDLVRCYSRDPDVFPPLDYLLRRAEAAVARGGQEAVIRDIVQRFIYEPNVDVERVQEEDRDDTGIAWLMNIMMLDDPGDPQ
ncbi:hypothetical protein F4778DRAFT_780245 [Xylariomycetidae sp. FL2044]|nr:hypothetical protein F4778DRAFT_780245 [Xylariomycetidae sp. FL2044]